MLIVSEDYSKLRARLEWERQRANDLHKALILLLLETGPVEIPKHKLVSFFPEDYMTRQEETAQGASVRLSAVRKTQETAP